MKKMFSIMLMILFATQIQGSWDFDMSSDDSGSDNSWGSLSDTFDMGKQEVIGNADTLIRLLYTEGSVSDLNENRLYDWTIGWASTPLYYTTHYFMDDTDPRVIAQKERAKMDVLWNFYKPNGQGHFATSEDGFSQLNADITALEAKLGQTKDAARRKVLNTLVNIAKTVRIKFYKRMMQDKSSGIAVGSMPSTSSQSLSEALNDARDALDVAKGDRNQALITTYDSLVKQLENIQREVTNLKNMNGSAAEALIAADKKLQTATAQRSKTQVSLYKEVIAQLNKDLVLEKSAEQDANAISSDVEDRVQRHGHAGQALVQAQDELNILQDELKILHDQRKPTQAKQAQINKHNKTVRELEIKAQAADKADQLIMNKVNDLLQKHDGDTVAALDEAKRTLSYSRIKINIDVVQKLEKQVVDEQKEQNKREKELSDITTFVEQKIAAAGGHPADALVMVQDELKLLQDGLKLLKDRRAQAKDIQAKQAEINKYLKGLDALGMKAQAAQAEDRIIMKKVEDLLRANNNDLGLALEQAQLKVAPLRGPKSTNKIDLEVLAQLQKLAAADQAEQGKQAAQFANTQLVASKRIKTAADPVEALTQAEQALEKLQVKLAEYSQRRDQAGMKAMQLKINEEMQIIEILTAKAQAVQAEDKRVTQAVEAFLAKYNGNGEKAIADAKSKAPTKGKSDPINKKILDALEKRVADDKEFAKNNDGFNIAMAKYNAASLVNKPAALTAVVAAVCAKAGISPDSLDDATRRNMVQIIQKSSDKLVSVVNNSRLSEMQKEEQKKAIISEAALLLASAISRINATTVKRIMNEGVTKETAQAAAIDVASNSIVSYLTGGMPMPTAAPADYSANTGNDGYGDDAGVSSSFDDPKSQAYATLDLPYGASNAQIKAAYRKLALLYHPDKNPAGMADFQAINEAYAVLTGNA